LSAAAGAEPYPRLRHVRPLDPVVGELVVRGYRASRTFRALVDVLEHSDVIVHVEQVARGGEGLAGSTRFVTRAGGQRYVRITLFGRWTVSQTVALIGHELQHAVEVANAEWVVDQNTCLELFHAIGRRSCNNRRLCYDTDAAIHAGQQVMRDWYLPAE
jgi:hypothetical protein